MGTPSDLSNQQAIVKAGTKKTNKPKIWIIPGGSALMTENAPLSKKGMADHLYNWFRSARNWDKFTLSFAKAPESYGLKQERVIEFPEGKTNSWDLPSKGKRWLADLVAEAITTATKPFVTITVVKDGVYFGFCTTKKLSPGDADWQPFYEIQKSKVEEYSIM